MLKKTPVPPEPKQKQLGESMVHTNTKYWSLTWETNVKQKKLPNEETLKGFFDRIADEAIFQYEIGEIKAKEHIQGTFTLEGPRQSKTSVLRSFEERFKNVAGLTLTPVYDKFAIKSYVTKSQGRTKGPFYGGKKEMYDKTFATTKLRLWQEQLFQELTGPDKEKLKDRKVIWVQDLCGNTGKSWFQKWLRIGQRELVVRGLPVSRVDRLMSAVNIVTKTTKVDAFTIDLTRTTGEEESYKDLFSAIETIKNGYAIDVFWGKYNEVLFEPPMVLIFTNHDIKDFKDYLSLDRWEVFVISPDGDLANESLESGLNTRLIDIQKLKNNKGSERTEPSLETDQISDYENKNPRNKQPKTNH